MLRQRVSRMSIFVLAFVAVTTAKPPPSVSPWATFGKKGPPFSGPGMSSIAVPYMPKSSPFFPKFVDPKTMISTKTDMLSNLFGGLGPVDYAGAAARGFSQYPSGYPQTPILYATSTDDEIRPTKEFVDAEDNVEKGKMKRGVFGPGGGKFGSPKISPFAPFGPKFSPFAPQFGPYGPSGFPFAAPSDYQFNGFSGKYGPSFTDSGSVTSRRRRSVVETEDNGDKALGPPPAYPGLAPIAEEPENPESKLLKLYDPASTPKETLPGMFGPFGPFAAGPFSPYAAEPYSPYAAVTEIPVPKSTIVPADFWLPSSIIPGPTEYTDKVSTFLSKLFDSLALNKTMPVNAAAGKTLVARSLIEDPIQKKIVMARSIDDVKTIAAAKDSIVDTIMSELGSLKTDMISTLNDFIVYQKTAYLYPGMKKPGKPLSPFAAFFAPPTPDPTIPFKQRMAVLDEVFDMLTGLQKNISLAIQEAIDASTDAPFPQDRKVTQTEVGPDDANYLTPGNLNNPVFTDRAMSSINTSLIDAIKSRLASMNGAVATDSNKSIIPNDFQADADTAKRDIGDEDYEIPEYYENHHQHDREQYKRAVQMQMHQGYQSMPAGTVESVQAGGRSVPGHQGGGIKLLDSMRNDEDWQKWSEWAEYFKNKNERVKNHHNHH